MRSIGGRCTKWARIGPVGGTDVPRGTSAALGNEVEILALGMFHVEQTGGVRGDFADFQDKGLIFGPN